MYQTNQKFYFRAINSDKVEFIVSTRGNIFERNLDIEGAIVKRYHRRRAELDNVELRRLGMINMMLISFDF